jgi:hypothetical protein
MQPAIEDIQRLVDMLIDLGYQVGRERHRIERAGIADGRDSDRAGRRGG